MCDSDVSPDYIEGAIQELEDRLSIPRGFLTQLKAEDDWSYVVKAHALVEAAIGHAITKAIDEPRLESWVLSHPLNGRTSKLSFLVEMGEISKHERRFVQALSQIRNRLVHDVSNVGFTFEVYFESLDADQRINLLESLSYALVEVESGKPDLRPIRDDPREVVWDSLRMFLAIMNEKAGAFEAMGTLAKVQQEFIEVYLSKKK